MNFREVVFKMSSSFPETPNLLLLPLLSTLVRFGLSILYARMKMATREQQSCCMISAKKLAIPLLFSK